MLRPVHVTQEIPFNISHLNVKWLMGSLRFANFLEKKNLLFSCRRQARKIETDSSDACTASFFKFDITLNIQFSFCPLLKLLIFSSNFVCFPPETDSNHWGTCHPLVIHRSWRNIVKTEIAIETTVMTISIRTKRPEIKEPNLRIFKNSLCHFVVFLNFGSAPYDHNLHSIGRMLPVIWK
jgi:hypothetical protein